MKFFFFFCKTLSTFSANGDHKLFYRLYEFIEVFTVKINKIRISKEVFTVKINKIRISKVYTSIKENMKPFAC